MIYGNIPVRDLLGELGAFLDPRGFRRTRRRSTGFRSPFPIAEEDQMDRDYQNFRTGGLPVRFIGLTARGAFALKVIILCMIAAGGFVYALYEALQAPIALSDATSPSAIELKGR
jgi:hypothetical protein